MHIRATYTRHCRLEYTPTLAYKYDLQLQVGVRGDGAFSLRGDAGPVTAMASLLEVEDRRLQARSTGAVCIRKVSTYVRSDAVVPQNDRVRCPFNTSLVVDAPVNVVVEEVEDSL